MVLVDSSVWIEALRRNGRIEIKLAIDEHFKKISALTGLALYEPGYGGMFRPE